jgi:hypothetical protein
VERARRAEITPRDNRTSSLMKSMIGFAAVSGRVALAFSFSAAARRA